MDRFMEQAIGGTPTLRLKNMEIKEGLSCKLYAKAEMLNPAGSIKDRVALSMIDDAEQRGVLKKGSVIIEPTSGNTGIAIAAIGAARGYRVIIVMPENMSEARKKIMRLISLPTKFLKKPKFKKSQANCTIMENRKQIRRGKN